MGPASESGKFLPPCRLCLLQDSTCVCPSVCAVEVPQPSLGSGGEEEAFFCSRGNPRTPPSPAPPISVEAHHPLKAKVLSRASDFLAGHSFFCPFSLWGQWLMIHAFTKVLLSKEHFPGTFCTSQGKWSGPGPACVPRVALSCPRSLPQTPKLL